MTPSRKNMSSVMNHQGFSGISILYHNIRIDVPNNYIKKNGLIRKDIFKYINRIKKREMQPDEIELFEKQTGINIMEG